MSSHQSAGRRAAWARGWAQTGVGMGRKGGVVGGRRRRKAVRLPPAPRCCTHLHVPQAPCFPRFERKVGDDDAEVAGSVEESGERDEDTFVEALREGRGGAESKDRRRHHKGDKTRRRSLGAVSAAQLRTTSNKKKCVMTERSAVGRRRTSPERKKHLLRRRVAAPTVGCPVLGSESSKPPQQSGQQNARCMVPVVRALQPLRSLCSRPRLLPA